MSHARRPEPSLPAASNAARKLDSSPEAEAGERIQRSLFGEILDWMLVPLLLLWPMSIAVTYLVAKNIANQPFDRALETTVTLVAQQVREVNGEIIALLPATSRDVLRADEVDTVYFQVLGPDGEHLEGDRDMPPLTEEDQPQPGSVQFRNGVMRGHDVRIAYLLVELNPPWTAAQENEPRRHALVQVGETLEKRVQLANEIIKGVILPQFIILPLALALVWFALTRGLSPLAQLQQHIRERKPDDLSPIESSQVPEEISPLVQSLNDMLERLSQTIQMQKRFIADAAHQMKTPLAGMRMQSELALRETNRDEIQRSLEQLSRSSENATRLVNQLLALARAENQTPEAGAFVALEVAELARQVVQDWVQASFTRKIDLGFEQPDDPVYIRGNPVMLRELLNNLIDNALHYTPSNGAVTVRIRTTEARGVAILEVEDSGPGIPEAERSRVFERFYRILGSNVEGSGLGLAIVREIAQQHAANIEILDSGRSKDPRYPGCLFRISFRTLDHGQSLEDVA